MFHAIRLTCLLCFLFLAGAVIAAQAADSGYPEQLLALGVDQPENTKLQAVSFPPNTEAVCYLTMDDQDMAGLIARYETILTAAGWTIHQSLEDYRGWLITASGHLHSLSILITEDNHLIETDGLVIEMSLQKSL